MSKRGKSFPNTPQLRSMGLAIFLFWSAVIWGFSQAKIARQLEYHVANRTEFYVRSMLRQSPKLDPRLKIFGYDDQSVAAFKQPELSAARWAKLIEGIAARRPRAIIIDQIFGFLPQGSPADQNELRQVILENPIVTAGAFTHSYFIPYRDPLDLERSDFELAKFTNANLANAHWLPTKDLNVYGPNTKLADTFAHIGHISYPGEGRIHPLLRVRRDKVIPHVTLHAAESIRLNESGLWLSGERVPLDGNGQIALNLSTPEEYFNNTRSLRSTIHLTETKQALTSINPGDIVLIAPLLYTGNHDVFDTPVGRIPGAFILAAMLNSVLTGEWLKPFEHEGLISTAVIAAATLLGLASGPVVFWPIFLSTFLLLCALPLLLFSYSGLIISWYLPVLGFLTSSLSAYAWRVSAWMLENRRLREALRGTIPESKLQAILAGRNELQREASERIVTLMFLDIANFSIVAEQNSPKAVFLDLKNILSEITKIVHKYGGTVDKTLGDGMLAFFGYSYDGEVTDNQADQAIQCAIELQRMNMRRCLDAAAQGRSILPFRIGINTGSVYIGDIGNEDRIDFTVIGNGVNYAQRLESACEHHSIMLSATTINFASAFHPKMSGFKKRYIHVKHHDELLEAIEYNPFHNEPETRKAAVLEFRKSFNIERKEQRWPVDDPNKMLINTDFGNASLVDFSSSGLCVRLASYLARGVVFNMELSSHDGMIKTLLEQKGISSIKAEVRWGKSSAEGFSHGLKLLNLSESQLEFLFSVLRDLTTKNREYA